VALALPLALAGCDDLLEVEDQDVVTDPTAITDPQTFLRGAIGDFAVAYVGSSGDEGQILVSGLLGDEWIHSGTFPTRSEIDIRIISEENGTLQGVTRNLYRARAAADRGIAPFEELDPNSSGHAEILSLSGFSSVFLAENYCSGAPFSRLLADGATFEFGGQESTEQILQRALDRANEAITVATAAESSQQLNLARVLKGRTLLDLGRFQEAAEAVAMVPTSFVYLVERSDNTGFEQNGVFVFNVIVERWSVSNEEGINGLPYRDNFTEGDPRTPWRRSPANDVGFDRRTAQYDQLKYPGRDEPVPLADGLEARLIEAEAALQAGDAGGFTTNLNAQREAQGIDELEDTDVPADMEGRVDLLFAERAYSLWLTSHRLGDMRRLIRQYGRPQDEVFPIGAFHKNVQGGIYGNDVNLPISFDERNNPEFSEFPDDADLCIDREA
jgi:hypothetical protein